MAAKLEHRKYIRYTVRLPVQLKTSQFNIAGHTTDLSINGLFLLPGKPLPDGSAALIGSTGDVQLTLDGTTIDASCVIRRVTPAGGIGISLQPLEADEVARIEAVLGEVLSLRTGGQTLPCTPDNRLANLQDWSEAAAEALARRDGVTLTPGHWEIIRLLRAFYGEYSISPPAPAIMRKLIRKTLGDEKSSDPYLRGLFTADIAAQATRYAGIPLNLDSAATELEALQRPTAAKPAPADAAASSNALEFEGRSYPLTRHGNLIDGNSWNERIAIALAGRMGIRLTAVHWDVIHFLRYFYSEFSIVPNVAALMKHLKNDIGGHWADNARRDYLYQLFPQGPSRQGSVIAGLPEPADCID